MRKLLLLLTISTAFLFTTSALVFAQGADGESVLLEPKVVKSIEVTGNKTISIATVLAKIKTRVGQDYIQAVISDDLKRLYNTGYFSDVSVDREDFEGGIKVIILLEEKSIVEEITYSKTKFIKSKVLAKNIKTKVGKFLDSRLLKEDVNTMKNMYEKKGLTSVQIDVEQFVDEVTNKASLHFVIKEGYKVKVSTINIYGNDSFHDKKLIKIIKSRKKGIFRSGFLKEDQLKNDLERITSFYEQQGYIDAIADYELDYLAKGRVDVNVYVQEGQRYYVGSVSIAGNDIISEKEVLRVMEETLVGGVFSREKLSVDLNQIRSLYFDRGYIFAGVNDSTSIDPDSGEVGVSIDIEEGDVAYLNHIRIQGNQRTRDIVVRRELKMYPGDRFDGGKLKKSKERLKSLGYFEEVAFDIEDTETHDQKDLVVQVKEAKTGTFSFGGGFSTVDKVVGFMEVEQRNFDFTNWPNFTGGGQHLSIRAETGESRNNYRLSFTEPWLFDRPLSGGFDAYLLEREREDDTGYAYDETRAGGAIRLGKRFDDDIHSITAQYKGENVKIDNFEPGVSAALLAEGGTNFVSQLNFSATRNTTNSRINPTKGVVLTGIFDLAGGIVGGDKDFIRTEVRSELYIPMKWKSVLEWRVRAGSVADYGDSNSVPIFERYFSGGSRSIRGYDERGVGPLDSATKDPIGGESIFVTNVEYIIPVIDFMKLAAFIDTGNVWADVGDFFSTGLKTGTGMGVRLKTPIGPVSLDYGWPLNDPPDGSSKEGKFYFSVSRGF